MGNTIARLRGLGEEGKSVATLIVLTDILNHANGLLKQEAVKEQMVVIIYMQLVWECRQMNHKSIHAFHVKTHGKTDRML